MSMSLRVNNPRVGLCTIGLLLHHGFNSIITNEPTLRPEIRHSRLTSEFYAGWNSKAIAPWKTSNSLGGAGLFKEFQTKDLKLVPIADSPSYAKRALVIGVSG